MGSGCNQTSRAGRPAIPTPDTGVKYTGAPIPSLGICTGDFLDEITAVLVNKIVNYATGEGISLPDTDFTQCSFLDSFTACCVQDKDLQSIINGILKSLCTLKGADTSILALIAQIQSSINYTIVPGCLSVANNKIDTVLNKLISSYCAFVTKVTAIFGDIDNPVLNDSIKNQIIDSVYVNLVNSIRGCSPSDVVKTGSGLSTVITVRGTCPVGTFLFGDWPVSHFDSSGLGLAEYGLCGWAIANGNNYVSDVRGFTFAMATNIPGAGDLHAKVDPVLNGDADYGTNIGSVKGEIKHRLTAPESGLPAHGHDVNDPGHTHKDGNFDRILQRTGTFTEEATDNNDANGREPALNDSRIIPVSTTGITVGNASAANASQSHENRQPTLYVNCIQRIS